jgi:hypothetical protein
VTDTSASDHGLRTEQERRGALIASSNHPSASLIASAPKLPEGISKCWQNWGYHVYKAGPCFDTLEQAVEYKASLDAEGVTWRRQP